LTLLAAVTSALLFAPPMPHMVDDLRIEGDYPEHEPSHPDNE
jgi:hypothetical protein